MVSPWSLLLRNKALVPFITLTVLGLMVSVLGIINMTGNISSLHSYHRHRVAEEDRKPFGRLVGLGTLIIGVAMILFGILFWIHEITTQVPYVIIGTVFLGVGIVGGLGLSFYAMIKYNKGIF